MIGAPRPRVVVVAKAPAPGRAKTRLCPPLSMGQAAEVAEAALEDTLRTVAAVPAAFPLLALDGDPGPWLPPGFDVVPQRGSGLDERIAGALEDAGGPALVIGMDTPQVTPRLLRDALEALAASGSDAVLGPALDGGWWALGLRRPDPWAVLGVPMSTPFTARAQWARLAALGLRSRALPWMRDVDTIEDAVAVAAKVPGSRFAETVRRCLSRTELEAVG